MVSCKAGSGFVRLVKLCVQNVLYVCYCWNIPSFGVSHCRSQNRKDDSMATKAILPFENGELVEMIFLKI